MDSLILEKTGTSPFLHFNIDTKEFLIEGECRPENVLTYFTPILNWLNKFKTWADNLNEPIDETLQFQFKVQYYNSSSAKFLFNILQKLKHLEEEGVKVNMNWYYDELDEDLLENGKEFEKILGLKFTYIPLKD